MVLEVVLVVLEVVLQLLLLQLLLLHTKSPKSIDLGGQIGSGPHSYIQVAPPGSDSQGPADQKGLFTAQTPNKLFFWGSAKFRLESLWRVL